MNNGTHKSQVLAAQGVLWLVMALTMAPGGVALAGQEVKIVDTTLANGMTVLLMEDKSDPLVAVWLEYDAGSRHEVAGKTGLAMVAAEVMGGSSLGYREGEYHRLIHSLGGSVESRAWADAAFYASRFPKEALRDVLLMEADRLEYPTVTPETVESAKSTVLRLRKTYMETNPYAPLVQELFKQMYTTHPYRFGEYGSAADITGLTAGDLDAWMDLYYRPEMATLTIVGDFKIKNIIPMVDEVFGDIPNLPREIPPIPPEPPQTAERRATVPSAVRIPLFIIGYHTVSQGDPDVIPLQLLARMLVTQKSAPVYRRLVNEEGMALFATGGHVDFQQSGFLFMYAFLNHDVDPGAAEKVVYDEIARFQEGDINPADLTIAKNQMELQLYTQAAGALPRANLITTALRIWGDGARWLKNIEAVRLVTVEDIQRVSRKYLKPENRTVTLLEPESSEESQ